MKTLKFEVSLYRLGDMLTVATDTHEKYDSVDAMIEEFRGYYGDSVSASTEVKVILFHLIA